MTRDFSKIQELIDTTTNKDQYIVVIESLYNNYINLKQDVEIDHCCTEKKYHEITLILRDNSLDIDLHKNIYFKFRINNYEFTYMLDTTGDQVLIEIINALFKGDYKLNIYGDANSQKELEAELFWTDNSMKIYNQRLKNYIPFPFSDKKEIATLKVIDGIVLI